MEPINLIIKEELETIRHDIECLFSRIERLEDNNLDLLFDIAEVQNGRNLHDIRSTKSNHILFYDLLNKTYKL